MVALLHQLDVSLPRYKQKHFVILQTLEMVKRDFIAMIAFSVYFRITFNNHMKYKPRLRMRVHNVNIGWCLCKSCHGDPHFGHVTFNFSAPVTKAMATAWQEKQPHTAEKKLYKASKRGQNVELSYTFPFSY